MVGGGGLFGTQAGTLGLGGGSNLAGGLGGGGLFGQQNKTLGGEWCVWVCGGVCVVGVGARVRERERVMEVGVSGGVGID